MQLQVAYGGNIQMEDERKVCQWCENEFLEEQLIEFEGDLVCSHCLDLETVVCSHCGGRIWINDNAGNDSVPLCERCYENHYTTCTHCERIINRDYAYYENDYSDEPYCHDCFNQYSNSRSIKDYGYKPEPIFHGDGNRFFGVELEVDEGGECEDSAYSVLCRGNCNGLNHIYCKHDGSLDDGFEIVTHPMTLDYHMNDMPWSKVLSKLRSMRYYSHQAGSCGLHIHVNRDTFGNTIDEQEACIGRVLYFFEKFWDELLKFSRRTQGQLSRWAARYGYKDHPKELLDHAKKGGSNGRYSCINLQNYYTVEFRMFRGTLKYNTLIATLQLVNRVCDVAFSFSDEEIRELSWDEFVSACTEPELIQYLKERNIYKEEV